MQPLKPFVLNRHGRIVFPSSFFPELDFSVFESLDDFLAVVTRDFDEKAPKRADILGRIERGEYRDRYALLRDVAIHGFWTDRFALTMYDKRPTRWADLPKQRDDVFLPRLSPAPPTGFAAAIERAYWALPVTWDAAAETQCFQLLLDVVTSTLDPGPDATPLAPTVPELLAQPDACTYGLRAFTPDYPGYRPEDVINCGHPQAELEALTRQAMVLHNQFRWSPKASARLEASRLRDEDYVVALHPKSPDVLRFLRRVRSGQAVRRPRPVAAAARPITPCPPVEVRKHFRVLPKVEALAVYRGELACTNDDLIRNHAYCCSVMTADEIRDKTGIEARCYSQLDLREMALRAAQAALGHSGRQPEEIAAVLFCSCTNTTQIPSVATWLSGQLGITQTHASNDIVAACAGMAYGFLDAVRILQEVRRPVLVVCAEKFSDKIGTVRTSRMIFGDGAAAVVLAPAAPGAASDIDVLQTYASGPWAEVDAIIWPNPSFDNNITVFGPEVKALVKRYLAQMAAELKLLPHPDGGPGSCLDAIEVIVPHQANKSMVVALAKASGLATEKLYFNIERVGNTSAASILLAIHDAVVDRRIVGRTRIFAPGFGAGAVAGYVVMEVDPAMIAPTAVREEPARLPVEAVR